ncbi:MAG: hypothetical protein WD052_01095 [Bacteroidales bacterium]
MLFIQQLNAQTGTKLHHCSGVVYDASFVPVPYTHVYAHGSGQGDVTDSLGIFSLNCRESDSLSFYNIAFNDTTIAVNKDMGGFYLKLTRKVYLLRGATVFPWGSTYGDFLGEVKRQGLPEDTGEKLGLPKQDPGVIPFDMNEDMIKSTKFLINSPVSYFYYNLSKREKGARRAFKLQRDSKLIELFEQTLAPENLNAITGLRGKELEDFIIYLNSTMICDYHCSELQLITEVHAIWQDYKK